MRTDKAFFLTAAVVTIDRLLHRHCARQCPTQAGEHHHEPVTHALHLDATRALDRAAQQAVVRLPQRLGRVRTEARRQLGGPHEVREERRDRLGFHCHCSPGSKSQNPTLGCNSRSRYVDPFAFAAALNVAGDVVSDVAFEQRCDRSHAIGVMPDQMCERGDSNSHASCYRV